MEKDFGWFIGSGALDNASLKVIAELKAIDKHKSRLRKISLEYYVATDTAVAKRRASAGVAAKRIQ